MGNSRRYCTATCTNSHPQISEISNILQRRNLIVAEGQALKLGESVQALDLANVVVVQAQISQLHELFQSLNHLNVVK